MIQDVPGCQDRNGAPFYPDYNGYNFSNINNTILSLFNISHRGRGLEKRLYGNICGPKKVVFVYIDGLGYDSWIN